MYLAAGDWLGPTDALGRVLAELDGVVVAMGDALGELVIEGVGEAGVEQPATARRIARPAASRRIGLNSG